MEQGWEAQRSVFVNKVLRTQPRPLVYVVYGCFQATMAGFRSCDRSYTACKPKIFTIWTFKTLLTMYRIYYLSGQIRFILKQRLRWKRQGKQLAHSHGALCEVSGLFIA